MRAACLGQISYLNDNANCKVLMGNRAVRAGCGRDAGERADARLLA